LRWKSQVCSLWDSKSCLSLASCVAAIPLALMHPKTAKTAKQEGEGESEQNLNFVLLSSHGTNFLHVFTAPYFADVFLNRHPNPEETNVVFLGSSTYLLMLKLRHPSLSLISSLSTNLNRDELERDRRLVETPPNPRYHDQHGRRRSSPIRREHRQLHHKRKHISSIKTSTQCNSMRIQGITQTIGFVIMDENMILENNNSNSNTQQQQKKWGQESIRASHGVRSS